MIANDEIVKTPAKFDNVIENISKFFVVWMFTKGENIIATEYPTQLQPIRGRPFLVFPCVIPCIKNSVRAQDDDFFRIQ